MRTSEGVDGKIPLKTDMRADSGTCYLRAPLWKARHLSFESDRPAALVAVFLCGPGVAFCASGSGDRRCICPALASLWDVRRCLRDVGEGAGSACVFRRVGGFWTSQTDARRFDLTDLAKRRFGIDHTNSSTSSRSPSTTTTTLPVPRPPAPFASPLQFRAFFSSVRPWPISRHPGRVMFFCCVARVKNDSQRIERRLFFALSSAFSVDVGAGVETETAKNATIEKCKE
uniref:Uncharacterized protein n=1 Tax=Plectus sambesii TaxID=2011161 RepID=A0A914WMM5_9BILA